MAIFYIKITFQPSRDHPQGVLIHFVSRANKVRVLILYFVDRASRYNSLLMTNLTHFFISLYITPLYTFRASQCSSSGDQILL